MNHNYRILVPFWGVEVDGLYVGHDTTEPFLMKSEHTHQHYELLLNLSQIPVRYTVNGTVIETNGPSVQIRAPHIFHSMKVMSNETYRRVHVLFPDYILRECGTLCDLSRLMKTYAVSIPLQDPQMKELHSVICHLRRLQASNAPHSLQIGVLAALLYEINAIPPADSFMNVQFPSYVYKIMSYIVENSGADCEVDTLASRFFISRTKLIADFHAAANLTVHEYVTAVRLWRAKSMLAEGAPLSVIAARCGYAQESSFLSMFRRETGVTPGEWRKTYSTEIKKERVP